MKGPLWYFTGNISLNLIDNEKDCLNLVFFLMCFLMITHIIYVDHIKEVFNIMAMKKNNCQYASKLNLNTTRETASYQH